MAQDDLIRQRQGLIYEINDTTARIQTLKESLDRANAKLEIIRQSLGITPKENPQ